MGTKKLIHKIADSIADILLPRKCAGCQKINQAFCDKCVTNSFQKGAGCVNCNQRNNTGVICPVHRITSLKKVLWSGQYRNELKDALWQLKYRKRKELAPQFGKLLTEKFFELYPNAEPEKFIAIPIPLHFRKESDRGFNQAELLANEFSNLTGIKTDKKLLFKIKDTEAQVKSESREARLKNLEDAFESKPIGNKFTIILIDDVSTTGTTLVHASKALAKAGAKKVIGLVVAH
jgi:ComF family protein